jgi:amino acid transporter
VSTVAKFGALMFLVLLSFVLGGGAGASTANFASTSAPVEVGAFGLALISVLWAYDGFADVSAAAGEIKDPGRTLPLAIVAGTIAIVAIYLAANAAYLYVGSIDDVARSPLVAADTMQALLGPFGVAFISVVVAVSTFGALMAIMLAAPRIFFAMAADGLLFAPLAKVHPRWGTPYVSILLTMLLGVMFVLTRTFDELAETFVLAIWPFYGLAVAGLYRLRRSRPDLARPFRVPGYPATPALFVAAVVYLVASALIGDPVWTGVTFAVVLAGIPVYYAFVAPRRTT